MVYDDARIVKLSVGIYSGTHGIKIHLASIVGSECSAVPLGSEVGKWFGEQVLWDRNVQPCH